MIAQIRGRIVGFEKDAVVLDVMGIGFRVFAHSRTLGNLGQVGDEAKVYTVYVVREDSVSLYGFETAEDRHIFEILCDVTGIGPKTAMGLMAVMSTDALVAAIAAKDSALLTRAPGIGKKTAERIVLEVKDKVALFMPAERDYLPSSGHVGADDAVGALVSLGYSVSEAERAVSQAIRSHPNALAEDLVKAVLSDAGKPR